jgi:hypothetical protein
MALSSQDMGTGRQAAGAPASTPNRTAPTYRAPLSRDALDPFRRPALLALAVFFWSLSGASTVLMMDDFLAVFGVTMPPLRMAILGAAVAVALTTSEIMLSESLWYFVPLAFDVGFMVWWSWDAFTTAARNTGAPVWGAAILGVALGALSAWAPERIVFGARRTK